ncbi:hypothetical protein FDP41_005815 [Naegleria fowleri]|uniref:Uncharacterized protein n=1 Tax=Naegleria fowleri TaxID=5763 RepID=A0A6A5BJL4_NAEFO|nr:uncharacterized protein FDP41_005815 [Naegleria fowleri]KAF0975062.1 hypothetical protein FDP41_005815 [Naegleria fowleri]CAG4708546.1 unnamed protein product [Naegleria fowleri]
MLKSRRSLLLLSTCWLNSKHIDHFNVGGLHNFGQCGGTMRMFHHQTMVKESTLRESKTLLCRNLLSRTPSPTTTAEAHSSSGHQRVLIAQSVHDKKIILIYIAGACIVCLTCMTLYHVYFVNTVQLHSSVPKNLPSGFSDVLRLEQIEKQVHEEKQKAAQTPIVTLKSVPDEHKVPLTVLLVGINVFFWVMVFKVKSRMISKLYVNNPNHYVKFRKQYMMNTAVSRSVDHPRGQTNSLHQQMSMTSIPLPVLLQQQQQRLLDELSFTANTLDKILPGKEITFTAKDVWYSENDGRFVYLRIGKDEQHVKRYFYCAQDQEESKELADFMNQISSSNSCCAQNRS